MRTFRFDLFADYHQFYIQDETAKGDLSQAWTEEANIRMLAVAPGVVGVATVRNMNVPVTIELHDAEPGYDPDEWDQVAECSLLVQSTRIVAAGCTDYFPGAARIEVQPGAYRVRALFGALSDLSPDGLTGNDHYRLQLWPTPAFATAIEPRLLKRHTPEPTP